MTALFEYIDNADPWAVLAIVALLLFVVTEVGYQYALRAVHEANRAAAHIAAHERIQGYAHGYRDGSAGAMPAVRSGVSVPEAYLREFREQGRT